MLNLSTDNSVASKIKLEMYQAPEIVAPAKPKLTFARLLLILLGIFGFVLCLPWTQTVPGDGRVTSLRPEQRPQSVQSIISGRIEEWYVGEGERVSRGDTILFISETKDEYFDPALLVRTQEQIDAKELAAGSYRDKADALARQISGLQEGRIIKLSQLENKVLQGRFKVRTDSTNLAAAQTNLGIADQQFQRAQNLFDEGLYSKTDLEKRRLKQREAEAKEFSAENKLLEARNELINAQIELNAVGNEYDQKIAKARSDRFSTLSDLRDAEISVSKLRNSLANYTIRRGNYYLTAPQDGYITQATTVGIGETIKEGQSVVTIMPERYDLAVELYVKPQDLPLLQTGNPVRLIFDGWPALVFSGWPNATFGTFGGRIVAIDRFTAGMAGKYRLLVAPDPDDEPWPELLRPGSGVKGMVLLGDVSIAFELWRRLNGFPPSFYEAQKPDNKKSDVKKKMGVKK